MALDTLRYELWKARDAVLDRLLGSRRRERIFTRIHADNLWGDHDSRSGSGSNLNATAAIRDALPSLWQDLRVRSLVDAPCGDFHWMRLIVHHLDRYTGVDIVPRLVHENTKRYGTERVRFMTADVTASDLPCADAVLCRDCFIHLPTRLIEAALWNIKRSGFTWLLLTTNPGAAYRDMPVGSFRPIDFESRPFGFPPPLHAIDETGDEERYLALWRVRDLPKRSH